jgi:hypothetical protein
VDAILAAFLAAVLGMSDARPPAITEPTETCEYYVSQAARQVLIVCEDRPDGVARHPALRQNPHTGPESGQPAGTYSSLGVQAGEE